MKNTRLSENAAIYNHREDRSEKEKWSTLTTAKKVQYFRDYYLKFVILGIVLTFFLGWLLYTMLSPKPKTALSISLISSAVTQEDADKLEETLADYLKIDKEKEDIFVDTTLFIDTENVSEASMASEQKMSVYSLTGEYDIVIAQRDTFERYASSGFFANLTEALPSNLYNDFTDHFYMAQVADTDDEEVPYGISIKDYDSFKKLNSGMTDPILGIMASSKNKQNAVSAIRLLTRTK